MLTTMIVKKAGKKFAKAAYARLCDYKYFLFFLGLLFVTILRNLVSAFPNLAFYISNCYKNCV